jgi:hypothetical protein
MSRRVVIGILIFLIVGVLGGIAALVISQLRTPTQNSSQLPQPTALPSGNNFQIPAQNPLADPDNDGLSNADEKIWGTNSANPDTDGDGFKDGVEVQKNHNPTIASPNDKLPIGFKPQQNVSPLEPAAPSAQSFESFFSESVDVTGGSKNLTQEYARTVADKNKTTLTLTQFVQAQPITTNLPKLNDAAIVPEQDIPLALKQYMSVAGEIGPISDKPLLSLAVTEFINNQNASGFGNIANGVKSFQTQIQALHVPPQAIQYHKLMVGYCELLAGTLSQILAYPNDQVKALVALRQLDAIDRQYYPIILEERARLLNLSK